MADLVFNDMQDVTIFTDVGGPTPANDLVNVLCNKSTSLDGIDDRKTTTQTPMLAGDDAFSISFTIKHDPDLPTSAPITQRDASDFTGDSMWDMLIGGTSGNMNISIAYRESIQANFIFAQTASGAYPSDGLEHIVGFSLDITNQLLFIMIDGVKPSHVSENLTGGTLSATAQGTMHNMSVGSRFSQSASQLLDGQMGRIRTFGNTFLSEAGHLTVFNAEQALIGTSPACPAIGTGIVPKATDKIADRAVSKIV